MINFLRRYSLLLIATVIGGASVLSSYMHVTPSPRIEFGPATIEHSSREVVKIERSPAKYMVIQFQPISGVMTYVNEDGEATQVLGLTYWQEAEFEDGTTGVICRIYGPIPTHVYNDPDMDTLGHEFLHCAVGGFHED